MNKFELLEIIGDGLLVIFGILLIYIFITIEISEQYGVEPNKYIRWFELFMGIPISAIGIERLIRDIRRNK